MGHFAAMGPFTFPNLNISTIWDRDPWVSIQINFWVSLSPTKEVPHTCKIVNYFQSPIYFWQGGQIVVRRGCTKRQWEWGQEGWGKGGGIMGVKQEGTKGGRIYIKIKFSTKQVSLH